MVRTLTFDTGALIALQSRRANMERVMQAANAAGVIVYVPQVVIAEWWRTNGSARCGEILRRMRVDQLTEGQAKAAGVALAALAHLAVGTGAALTIDAIVSASAAERGDSIYTSDPEDLLLFKQQHFSQIGQILRA
jgi:predicted nucleic acid-binding protein